ncbi:MAG: AMP-binding protein [Alphaproteobacteria bacterium]|nr:AMP-binding protein [Alphaproteobacteria bacterium]
MGLDNFYATLKRGFDSARTKPFLTLPGAQHSYGEVDARAAHIAGALMAAGARPGDRMVVQVEKSPDNVALYLAALRTGLIYVPLNTAYTPGEVGYFLNDAEPSVFVCDPPNFDVLAPIAKTAGVQTIFTLGADGAGTLSDALEAAAPFEHIQPRHEDDLASILYTSGTTGRSKGAMLSHGNLASNAITLNALWGMTSKDVLIHALPIFHIHGLFVALHTAMLSACEIIFLPKFDVAEIRRQLPRASMMMGVPTFYSRLLGEAGFSREESAHMRLFISGSAPLTDETFNAFEARTGHKILERYGMSEAGMIASNPLDGTRLAGTVGFALPGVSLRIADDAGSALPASEPGIVEVKGPNVFKGYWRMPQKTKQEFRDDGFFITGDIGALDKDGRLSLIGRAKDLIIAGGYNIYPKEIEAVLDAISGVHESAVIGLPHADMGEGVAAVLVAENGPVDDRTIETALAVLAKFKRPRKLFWTGALPRNAMGKVQKQVLRERYKEAFSRL